MGTSDNMVGVSVAMIVGGTRQGRSNKKHQLTGRLAVKQNDSRAEK